MFPIMEMESLEDVERIYVESQLYRLKALDEERFVEAWKLRNLGLALQELMQIMHEIKYDPNQPRIPAGSPEGGRWTVDETDEQFRLTARRFFWAKPETLKKHVADHGRQFNTNSSRVYAREAQEFRKRAIKHNFPAVQDKHGTIRIYDPKSGTFAVFDEDGKTRTMYKPRRGHRYFEGQIRKHTADGGRVINPLPESGNRGTGRGSGGGGGGPFNADKPSLPGSRFRPPNR